MLDTDLTRYAHDASAARPLFVSQQQAHCKPQWPQAAALLEDGKAGVYVRLLVVDSVANVFRDVGDNPGVRQYAARSELLFKVCCQCPEPADVSRRPPSAKTSIGL